MARTEGGGTAVSAPAPLGSSGPPAGLISLEAPFNIDDFSALLGQTTVRIEVPRADLPEALRRICEFMEFGIYIYEFSVRPAAADTLKRFVVEMRRVDFSAASGRWEPFVERGRADTPFGPSDAAREPPSG